MTPTRRRIDVVLAVLAGMALLLIAGMMYLQQVQLQAIEETVSDGRTMGEWDVFQLQVEHLKLRAEIDATLREQGQGESMARLGLRSGIFASRFDIVRDGLSRRLIGNQASYRNLVAALSLFSLQSNQYFGSDNVQPVFDEAGLLRLRAQLDETTSPIQAVLLDSNHARHQVNAEYLSAVRTQVRFVGAICLALLLVACAFGGLALRQMRLTVRRSVELEEMHIESSYRAAHDSLTGLINRDEFERALRQRLETSVGEKVDHAVLFIDLDRFKVVNDTCGHGGGDILLREVARLIRRVVRASDTVARVGGDEFAVVLADCDQDGARLIAEQICRAVDDYRFVQAGQSFHIGASIGLVMLGDRWPSVSAVMQAADSACYIAKETGRNRVYLYQDSDLGVQAQRGITSWVPRLHRALDEGRLRLYWQRIVPLCAAPDERLRGEVLVRLLENGELIEPGAFLPVAERYALAARIDRWVVTELFERLSDASNDMSLLDSLSINLSGQSVSDPEFQAFLIRRLGDVAFDRRRLCFEVTETSAITNLHKSIAFFEALRGLGARVSLDDFGSGMSSFIYLKNLPVDCLKIDGQFMRQLGADSCDQATVRAICEVARATGIQTVAEGVETEEVASMLRTFGVQYGQGYLWHSPAPLETLLHLHRPAPDKLAPFA